MDANISYFLALMAKKEVSNTGLVLFGVILSNLFFNLVIVGLHGDII